MIINVHPCRIQNDILYSAEYITQSDCAMHTTPILVASRIRYNLSKVIEVR